MSITGRKVFGYILSNILIMITTLLVLIFSPEVFGEWGFPAVIIGILVINFVFVMGNVLSKLLTPETIKELLINKDVR